LVELEPELVFEVELELGPVVQALLVLVVVQP
jgi:hypothetical protein